MPLVTTPYQQKKLFPSLFISEGFSHEIDFADLPMKLTSQVEELSIRSFIHYIDSFFY